MGLVGFSDSTREADLTPGRRRYWLFYAGPENYLSEAGVRELPGETFWSCEPQTREGDLILVYRKSMNQLSVDRLVEEFGMARDVATAVKRKELGRTSPLYGKPLPALRSKLPGTGRMGVRRGRSSRSTHHYCSQN
jgi:hypothetical protein